MKKSAVCIMLVTFILALFACSLREKTPESVDITVQFVTDGTKVRTVTNTTINSMPVSEKEGFVIEGWYEDEERTKRVSFPFRALNSCKLYIKWIDKEKGNEEITYKLLPDGTYSVEKCTSQCATIWIPDTFENGRVTVIEEGFLRYKTIVHVIHIGKNIERIEENFSRCIALKEYDVDEKNEYWESEEGVLYSEDGTLLYDYPTAKEDNSYVLPDTVVSLGESAFSFNLFLNRLTLNSALIASYTAFKKMESLAYLNVKNGNESFQSKGGVLYSPDGKKLLLFPVNYEGENYYIAAGTEEVIEGAFSESKIENLNINKELSTFIAPEKVPNLKNYFVEEGNAYFVSRDGVLFVDGGETLYLVPQGRTGKYSVPDGVKDIYEFSFSGSKLTEVVISSSVLRVGKYAFNNCESLEKVIFEENSQIIDIEGSAFSRCTSLAKVVLTSRIPPETEEGLFDSCPSTISIVIPFYTEGLYKARWAFCTDSFSATGTPVQLFDVTFDAKGGTPVDGVHGAYVLEAPLTTREDPSRVEYYIFLGWYDNPEGTGERIVFPYAVTQDITLYAAWDLGIREIN